MAGRPAPLLDAFGAWLLSYGDAWEQADADQIARLFAMGATFQPTPFAGLLRARPQIREHWRAELEGLRDVQFRAQVLGAGDTYGIAHFRVSYSAADRGEVIRDGILLAALDARGRCTSLREWWHEAADLRRPTADA